jgi:hypothetical protein
MGRASRSVSDLKYSRPSAAKTTRVPSGDTARTGRESVSCPLPGTVIPNRVTGRGGAACRGHKAITAAAPTAAPASANPAQAARDRPDVACAGLSAGTADGFLRTNNIVETSPIRSEGFLTRHASSSERTDGGIVEGSASQAGSLFSTAASVSLTSSPSKGRLPVSIS